MGLIRVDDGFEEKMKKQKAQIENILGFQISMNDFSKMKSATDDSVIAIEKRKNDKPQIFISREPFYYIPDKRKKN